VAVLLLGIAGVLAGAASTSTGSTLSTGHPSGYYVTKLAVAPSNPLQIVAVADYYPANWESVADRIAEYILVSNDGGQTWATSAKLPYNWDDRIQSIALLGDEKTLLAVHYQSGADVIRSEDGGKTWSLARKNYSQDTSQFSFIVADPSRPSSAWACISDNWSGPGLNSRPAPGLLRTDDGGKHWKAMKIGSNCHQVIAQPHGNVVIATTTNQYGSKGGYYRSTNHGANWKRVTAKTCHRDSNGCVSQYQVINDRKLIYFDSSRPRTAIACTMGDDPFYGSVLYRSNDAGAHWRPAVVIGARSYKRGTPRIYTKFKIHLLKSPAITDTAGKRIYPRGNLGYCGAFNVGQQFTIMTRKLVMQSSDHGQHWTMKKTAVPRDVDALGLALNSGNSSGGGGAVTSGDILVDSGGYLPSALWHFRLSDRTWRKVPLGIPAPTATTTTTS
jgi:hypothetical protein